MPYLHQSICISPQDSYPEKDFFQIRESKNNLLEVIEPSYPGIPPGMRRRMGKNVRMAVGAAIPLLENQPSPAGVVIATANGGMEDCIKFLNQIIEYKEGLLTPANFVQSTSNAAAAQIALATKNHSYNITHVHRGLAFENAMLDVIMLLKENDEAGFLLGSTDEISSYNYNIDRLAGWFRKEPVLNTELFQRPAKGTLAGEGAFMSWIDNQRTDATANIKGVKTIHSRNPEVVMQALKNFMIQYLPSEEHIDLLLTGENGDERLLPFYEKAETVVDVSVPVARFKHLCGEYCTASSFAVWLCLEIFKNNVVPEIIIKRGNPNKIKNVLIYNNYRGEQHAFILISAVH